MENKAITISVVIPERNRGLSVARNTGTETATGDSNKDMAPCFLTT